MTRVDTELRARVQSADRSTASGGFRPDVEGMRAVAVWLVLLYHAGFPFLRGGYVGVDVFFVISGFLITGMLVREVQRDGRVSLARFYARRAKRLLPAAALVLVVTALMTWLFLPITDRRTFGGDIVAAALYAVNWRFADRSVDYLAEDVGISPVQHFWSLAVEEQFYIVWPLLLVLVAWWVRRTGRSVRATMGVGLAVIAVPSLLWSITMTADQPAAAFFVSTTRLWELAIGAAVAISAPALATLSRVFAAMLAWAGLAAVVASALIVTAGTAWPGYVALLPTLGTGAVIAAGPAAGSAGPVAILGLRPMVWIGGLSYSLYLWHWPLIVVATERWGELSVVRGLLVVLFSFVPAWLAWRFLENPVRFAASMSKSPRLALSVGANLSLLGVVAGLILVLNVSPSTSSVGAKFQTEGAAVLAANPAGDQAGAPVDHVAAITPAPLEATADTPDAYGRGCQVRAASAEPVSCEYGDPQGELTIALVGDSKALQWINALDEIGKTRGWRVVTFTKSACSFTDATITFDGEIYESCSTWNDAVLEELTSDPPDLIVTSQGKQTALDDRDDADSNQSREAMIDGLVRRWSLLTASGSQVVVLADTPQPGMNVYECAAENPDHLTACAFDRADAVRASAAPTQQLAVEQTDVVWIDLTDAICPVDRCAAVIGNALVYRQGSHLTATYVESLAPRLEAALEEIVE